MDDSPLDPFDPFMELDEEPTEASEYQEIVYFPPSSPPLLSSPLPHKKPPATIPYQDPAEGEDTFDFGNPPLPPFEQAEEQEDQEQSFDLFASSSSGSVEIIMDQPQLEPSSPRSEEMPLQERVSSQLPHEPSFSTNDFPPLGTKPEAKKIKKRPPPLPLEPTEQSIKEYDIIVGDDEGEMLQLMISEAMEEMEEAVEIARNKSLELVFGARTKFSRGVDLSLSKKGDLLVDTTTFRTDWSSCSSVPVADRLNPDFAESLYPETRLFFLLPPGGIPEFAFSETTMQMFIDALSYGWTRKTAATKGGHLLKYLRFCLKEKIPTQSIFPSFYKIVYPWLATLKGKLRAKTISGYLTSIRSWHAIHGARLEENEDQWRILYNGLKRFQPPPKKPKIPVTIPDLLAIYKHLNLADLEHYAQWAASLVAFSGMVRGGSLMLKSQTSFDPRFDIKRSDVRFPNENDSSARTAPETAMTVFVPFDKVDGTDGRTYYCVKFHKNGILDPIKTLK